MFVQRNGNLALAQSAIEQLSGDSNLISVRSRASRERQFTVVNDLQSKAETAYQSKIKELETTLTESQTKLAELKKTSGEKGQKFIFSPEAQEEKGKIEKKVAEVNKQLKEERKKLRADIDSLANRCKWINILGMPVIVAGFGLFLAVVRHNRRAAR